MNIKVGQKIIFLAQFTASKLGLSTLTPTVEVARVNPDGTHTWILGGTSGVAAGSASHVVGGVYKFTLSETNTTLPGWYLADFGTSDTSVDCRDVPSCVWVGLPTPIFDQSTTSPTPSTFGHLMVENLDAKLSTRLPTSSYVTPPTTTQIADDFLAKAFPSSPGAGSVAEKFARLDASVSTRLATSSYVTPPTTTQIADDFLSKAFPSSPGAGSVAEKFARLDASVSSRLASTSYVTPPTTTEVSNAIFNTHQVQGSQTFAQLSRITYSALAGLVSGYPGNTVTFKSLDGSKNRIVATTDSNGNRLSITVDGT